MFAVYCPTKRDAFMTHAPAFSIQFWPCSFHREWQPAKPRTGVMITWEFSNIFSHSGNDSGFGDDSFVPCSGFFTDPFLSGVMDVFSHVSCAPQHDSQ